MAPTFQLSNITFSSTINSIPTPFIGLQDALNIKYSYDIRDKGINSSLFLDACQQDDNKQNCTTSCLDNKQTFASLYTLHNCVVWPSVYVEDENDGLLPGAADLARSLGLEKGSAESSLPSEISTSIQSCLLDACDNNDECKTNANKLPGGFRKQFSAELTGNLYYGFSKSLVYFDPCQFVDAPATADVAGIGVLTNNSAVQRICLPRSGLHIVRDANGSRLNRLRFIYSLEKYCSQRWRCYSDTMAQAETRGGGTQPIKGPATERAGS